MPATSPPLSTTASTRLMALGQGIRAKRKALGISATVTAEAAGISRVTLHRIELGEPSVAMASYMNALTALGLELEIMKSREPRDDERPSDAAQTLPASVAVQDFPQLRRLVWQRDAATRLTPEEALALYERNWRHVDVDAITAPERDLIERLARDLGGGRLLV